MRELKRGLLDLPTELLHKIVNYFGLSPDLQNEFTFHGFWKLEEPETVNKRRALLALSLTCRRLYQLTVPILYSCLLCSTSDREDQKQMHNAIFRTAAVSPSILRHTLQIQVSPGSLGVLLHTPKLTGLSLDYYDPLISSNSSLSQLLPAVFPNLLHLHTIDINGITLLAGEVELLLQNLHHLSNVQSLLLFYAKTSEYFNITVAPISLRRLELHGCNHEVMQSLLQGLVASHLQDLQMSELNVAGDVEVKGGDGYVSFAKLRSLHLQSCKGIVTSRLLSIFTVLEHIKLSLSYISPRLMSELLEWLPASTRLLELEEMSSLVILKTLSVWLEHSGSRFRSLTIQMSFDQANIEDYDHGMETWNDHIWCAREVMELAQRHGITLVPGDLENVIWLMQPEFESPSEGDQSSEPESLDEDEDRSLDGESST